MFKSNYGCNNPVPHTLIMLFLPFLQECFPSRIQAVYIIKPEGFWERHKASSGSGKFSFEVFCCILSSIINWMNCLREIKFPFPIWPAYIIEQYHFWILKELQLWIFRNVVGFFNCSHQRFVPHVRVSILFHARRCFRLSLVFLSHSYVVFIAGKLIIFATVGCSGLNKS